jgi:hypothetical protein
MNAQVEWDGEWVAVIDGHDNVFTSAKRLEQLPGRLVEVMHLMTGKTTAPEDWQLEVRLGGDDALARAASELKAQRVRVEDEERQLAEETARIARLLRKMGMNLRDIGTMLGVSYQRIHQIAG